MMKLIPLMLLWTLLLFVGTNGLEAEDVSLKLGNPYALLASKDTGESPIETLLSYWDVDQDGMLSAGDLGVLYERFFMSRDYLRDESMPVSHFEDAVRIWGQSFDPESGLQVLEESVAGADPRISLKGIIDSIKNALNKYYPVSDIEEIRLALTGNPTQMSVSWNTPSKPTQVIVHYGVDPTNLNMTVQGNFTFYKTHNKLLGILGLGYVYTGWISQATMINIPRDSVIYYVCSNGSSSSPVNQFRSPASQSVPTRFAALGDQGTFYPVGFKVAEQIAQLPALDMVLHAGDLCYAGTSGSSSGQEIEEIWDYWGRQNQQFSAKVPYMLTVGNHEQFYNFTSFIHRFHMPQNGVGSFLYSYDVGFFHVLSFSSEQSYTPGTEQYNFIVNDLQQASQNLVQVPWIVVVDHRPFYCSDQGEYEAHNGDPSTSTLSKYLEPLFVQYRVNLVINGHMHVFERSLPVFNATSPYTAGDDHYTTKIAPPVYITVGSGGIFLDWKWIDPQPSWSAYRASEWGVAVVEANATTLHYQFQTTLGRQIKDEFWISNL